MHVAEIGIIKITNAPIPKIPSTAINALEDSLFIRSISKSLTVGGRKGRSYRRLAKYHVAATETADDAIATKIVTKTPDSMTIMVPQKLYSKVSNR